MDRCHLKGSEGDALHAVLCAAGYNIRWLLRMIAQKGLTFWAAIFLFAKMWANQCHSALAKAHNSFGAWLTAIPGTQLTKGYGHQLWPVGA